MTDPDDLAINLLAQIAQGVVVTLAADLACVLAIKQKQPVLYAAAMADNGDGSVGKAFSRAVMQGDALLTFPLSKGTNFLSNVLRTREPMFERQVAKVAQLVGGEALGRGAVAVDAQTITLFPLTAESKRLGLLLLLWRRAPEPSNTYIPRLLPVLSNQLAAALENQRLVAELKRSEAQARTTQRFYERVVNIAGNGMFLVDHEERIVFANKHIKRMLAYTDAELLNRPLRDLFHARGRDTDAQQVQMDETGTVAFEKHLIRSDDNALPVMMTYVPPPKRDKNVSSVVIVTDLTTLKDREVTLMRRTRQLSAINQAARIIAASLDYEIIPRTILAETVQVVSAQAGSILLVDEETQDLVFRAVVGPGGEGLVGMHVPVGQGIVGWIAESGEPTLVADTRKDERFYSNIDDSTGLNTRSLIGVPLQIKRNVIGVLEVINKLTGEFDEEDLALMNTLAQWAAVAIDNARLFSDLSNHAHELELAYEELKRIDKIKDEMIQNVSHELRTPLMHIISYVDMILEGYFGDLTPEQEDGLTVARRKADQLNRLINDIVTLQQLSGVPRLERNWIQLEEVANQAVKVVQITARSANCTVELTVPQQPLPDIYADEHRLGQVFDNLVMNSIKFSPDGGEIKVHITDEPDYVRVTVTDQGIGIASEKIEQIFRRFYQVDGSTTRRYAGLGLGLAICRQIVETHGGKIWVESEGVPGKGTQASFRLPKAVEGAPPNGTA